MAKIRHQRPVLLSERWTWCNHCVG